MFSGFSCIGMSPAVFAAHAEAAAARGDPRARMILAALHGPTLAERRAQAFAPVVLPRARSAPAPAAVPAPGASPGPRPFALEAARLVRDGEEKARAPIDAARLQLAQNSIRLHAGAGLVGVRGRIGPDGLRDTSAFDFCRRLDALKAAGARAVIVDVDSHGGSVVEGFAMIRAIERASQELGPVVARVRDASSMALVVAVSCSYAIVDPDAGLLTLHDPVGGPPADLAHFRTKIREVLGRRTLMDAATLDGLLGGEVPLTPRDAWSYGVVDEVGGPDRVAEVIRTALNYGGLSTAANSWRWRVLMQRTAAAESRARRHERLV